MPVTGGSSVTASLPNGYAVTVGIVNQLGCPANGGRQGLIFYNDSASAILAVCPASLTPIPSGTAPSSVNQVSNFTGVGAATLGVAAINGAGSVTLTPGQSFIIDNMACTGAWNAISSAPAGALTVLEF